MNKHVFQLAAMAAAASLVACGGGGSGGGGGMGGLPLLAAIPLSAPAPAPAPAAAPMPAPAPAAPSYFESSRKDCSITFYGDSVFDGFNAISHLDEFPADTLRRMRPKYRVVSRTVSADSFQRRMPLFANQTVDTRFVSFELGLVDAINGYPLDQNARGIVQRGIALNATVVLTGIGRTEEHVPRADDYDARLQVIAKEERALFADIRAIQIHDGDTVDRVHPTQALSNLLIGKLVATLDSAAPECKP
ncbi:hypothetical protein FHT32_001245 [Variovorax sp. SG517]|uniref:SGNH/GDSL hydrolase family protein n=1 Tax=Variovorax sp. SG517 TaxID=2587117 RepID=UPI00159D66F1|nr:SGNH/GDSL hydrolase family protein [Variovorax sp. SG517]NVM87606.1 hypothetical protein [Variovorax sp. SG517]